ncbi:MAG: HAMP domain-containing histidine kinase, partial [Bryobacteraceae bacterium]|nr:HAMP domain-containing histidine kinase [Bryobacteraceae bacterium]
MLHEFLLKNRDDILAKTEEKSLALAGIRPSSGQLREGLPLFYAQLLNVLRFEQELPTHITAPPITAPLPSDVSASFESQREGSRVIRLNSSASDTALTDAGGVHGVELQRLGYTLTHVVHSYGAMCQSITELATEKDINIKPNEFRDLNRCLDIAIAGAVSGFESKRQTQEDEQFGSLAHELRNALGNANISLQLIKNGTVGFSGSTGRVLERSLQRIGTLVNRSLTEVRLRVDPSVHFESSNLLQLVDQISITALVEARSKDQTLEIKIDPALMIEADSQLFLSALSNLIQNALKYTRVGGRIQVRGIESGNSIVVEV